MSVERHMVAIPEAKWREIQRILARDKDLDEFFAYLLRHPEELRRLKREMAGEDHQ